MKETHRRAERKRNGIVSFLPRNLPRIHNFTTVVVPSLTTSWKASREGRNGEEQDEKKKNATEKYDGDIQHPDCFLSRVLSFGEQEEKELDAAKSKKMRRTASTNGVSHQKYFEVKANDSH